MIKKIFKYLFYSFVTLLILYIAFYLSFVVPNDKRLKEISLELEALPFKTVKYFDFIENLPQAKIKIRNLVSAKELLSTYSYKSDHSAIHHHNLHLHLSLGWYPMKTDHRNALFAPPPSEISYELQLPENPLLTFGIGIISSIEKKILASCRFSIYIEDLSLGKSNKIFEKEIYPLKPYPWKFGDGFYKNFYKYLKPKIEEREGKWDDFKIELKDFSKKKVRIIFKTETISDEQCLAFWANPLIMEKVKSSEDVNILMVTVDSFRPDSITEEITPNLYTLMQKSVTFENAFANSNMTHPSIISLLHSKYPLEIGSLAFSYYSRDQQIADEYYAKKINPLPAVLKKANYNTAAIGVVSLFTGGHGYSCEFGFDQSIILEHTGYNPLHVTETTINWLKENGNQKFFLFLYYDGPHGPYRPPLHYFWQAAKKFGLKKFFSDFLYIGYIGEVIYHDVYFGKLFEAIKKLGLEENTLIIFTADHTDTFRTIVYDWPTKRGPWKKKKVKFNTHGVSVTEDDVKVPLIFHFSSKLKPKKIKNSVQLLDLAPTITDFVGLKNAYGFGGKSLLDLLDGRDYPKHEVLFIQGSRNRGIRWKDKYLYIQNLRPRDRFPPETLIPEELYDLETDSPCLRNLVSKEPKVLAAMRKIMNTFTGENFISKFVFKGMNKQLIGEIKVKGILNDVKTNGGSVILEKFDNSFKFKTLSDGEIIFITEPDNADFWWNLDSNGEPVLLNEIFCGSLGLPLFNSNFISSNKLDFISGSPRIDHPGIFFGREKEISATKKELDASKMSLQLKTILEEWGYITK